MSEGIEVSLLVATVAVKLAYALGRALAGQPRPVFQRRLLVRQTQIADGDLLRQTLDYLGFSHQAGDRDQTWGEGQAVELQVNDAAGRPWFALTKAAGAETYSVLSLDRDRGQADAPEAERLSEEDPLPALAQVAQHYGYARVMRELMQSGFELAEQSETEQADGSKTVRLQRIDPASGEQHTVQLVFKALAGQATILTDSRRADGSHGVCPDLDATLRSAGIADYDKWTSPAALQARAAAAQTPRTSPAAAPARSASQPRERQAGE